MTPDMDVVAVPLRTRLARWTLQGVVGAALIGVTAYSAVLAKEARRLPALAAVEHVEAPAAGDAGVQLTSFDNVPVVESLDSVTAGSGVELLADQDQAADLLDEVQGSSFAGPPVPPGFERVESVKAIDPHSMDPNTRWFDGRPIKPVAKMWMTVTGYSPDARSCGDSADGLTATLHSVHTNAARLVAADPKVLPYGSMITVPGYDTDLVVPVLDCGGAIKGRRLDLLFPTHEQALQWGVKRLLVTVWGYADGKPMENPRKQR